MERKALFPACPAVHDRQPGKIRSNLRSVLDPQLIVYSVADMVKRFQTESSTLAISPTKINSRLQTHSRTDSRHSRHDAESDSEADSVKGSSTRPRMRRGRTEQVVHRHKEAVKLGAMSDNERSYAANASRIPSIQGRRPLTERRALSRGRASLTAPPTPPRSGRASPLPNVGPSRKPTQDGRPRMPGKGKSTRPTETATGRSTPGPMMIKTATRRSFAANSNRVTSIARHFDRLSREAERERQKRLSAVRGKRARPVSEVKATVQVFSNLRDAFKDESDTDSSIADDEDDEEDSGDNETSTQPASPVKRARRRSSSVAMSRPVVLTPVIPSTSTETMLSTESTSTDPIPVSASASSASVTGMSVMSEPKSEMSFTERLKIELPSFETSAPLPSVPVTPHLSTDPAEDTKSGMSQFSQASDSEFTSGGERSSILKTLTGLWAFRAGDYTPLEYPL